MKKLLVASIVGGIIIFFWQFLSWTLLNLHRPMQQYTPNQDKIMEFLEQNLEEGFYYLPGTPDGASQEEQQKLMESSMGKPWAQIYYHKSMDASMGMSMARGAVADILAVLLLTWMLLKMGNASFQTIFLSSVAVGLIGYIIGDYTQSVWFQVKTIPDLIDAIVQWGLVGLWLGWWLRR